MFRFAAALFVALLIFPTDQPCGKEASFKPPPAASLKRTPTANGLEFHPFPDQKQLITLIQRFRAAGLPREVCTNVFGGVSCSKNL
jgi:hypothetical protein